ncbi:MAG: anti-sigma F factor [Ruminococcaceae bacterium]|nr:anti-sigma F factor [Oscillospiraceae bacterium]
MNTTNEMDLKFAAKSINEGFARVAVSAFVMGLDPTIAELSDIKTAVSEAVTNCIVHAYPDKSGLVYINVKITEKGKVIIKVRDKGCGISDVKKAMEPLYTTGGEERAGLGFAVMQSFMDKITVRSSLNKGTTVTMEKAIIRRGKNDRER